MIEGDCDDDMGGHRNLLQKIGFGFIKLILNQLINQSIN